MSIVLIGPATSLTGETPLKVHVNLYLSCIHACIEFKLKLYCRAQSELETNPLPAFLTNQIDHSSSGVVQTASSTALEALKALKTFSNSSIIHQVKKKKTESQP